WFKELLDPSTDLGGRFLASLGRNLFFSLVILAIEVPLGIVIALWLAYGAFRASSNAIDHLMDKEWPEAMRADFIEVAARQPGIKGIHDFRTRHAGTHDFAQFHMEVPGDITVAQAHKVVEGVERALHKAFPKVEVLIHLDPEGHVD
ncbi:cation diffusion facilitator family transporter, partial [Pseudomonas hunanensis]|uniref:cation diffusion facilitator family transporter n=1 Tax=Pseudomonas hunanensis TaxID=1247546 RepID=UPI0030DB8AE3